MDTESRELQNLAATELSNLTVFSIGTDARFSKLMHIDERIVSRYGLYYVSSVQKENDKTKRSVIRKMSGMKDSKVFILAFSYPDQEKGVDKSILDMAGEQVTVIDATGVAMLQECNERYALCMARYSLAGGRQNPAGAEYIDRAYEELRPWTEKLLASPVRVYDGEHPEGAVCDTLRLFFDRVLREICEKYPVSPDTMDLDAFFYRSKGARYHVRDGYYGQILTPWDGVTDPERTPDRLFAFVWGDDSAWSDPQYADEKVVILKKAFDAYLEGRLAQGEKISFAEIFGALRKPPYGLIPNNIGAILMGMFFRTWRNRGLIWTNGFQQDVLDDAHLLTMVGNGIHNQHTFYPNSLTDSILLPGKGTSALTDAVCELFSLNREENRFLPELRSDLRFALEELPYPLLAARYEEIPEADRKVIDLLLRFVRETSDGVNGEDSAAVLNAAFQADDGLKERLKACLTSDALRAGFESMLEKNGLDPAGVTEEMLEHVLWGRPGWKWIWQEETVIRQLHTETAKREKAF